MELIIIANHFVKMFIVTLLTYFTYIKITDYKGNDIYKNIFVLLYSIIIAMLYIITINFIPPLVSVLCLYCIYGIIIRYILGKNDLKYNLITYIISCIVAYVIYLISILISGIILLPFLNKSEHRNPISLLMIPTISIFLFAFTFTRKRFKKGFNFLKNKNADSNIRNFTMFLIGVIIIIYGFSQRVNSVILTRCIFLGAIFIMISIVVWIKSQITKTYKNRMRDRTIEMQKAEIDEQARIMEELKAENLKLASAVHKYNKKFSSLEFAIKNALALDSKTEFANELAVILEEAKDTSKNFAKEVEITKNKLPLTNITGIDNMFKYMQDEASKNNINFDLKINESINSLVDNIISKDKFETLIGDHLKDAIIAVKASEASYKSILVTLGLVEGNYEFSVYDTGVEFEIDTLLKLGKEQVTTHKDEGGSGIGFMTTFETLKECKASLIIEEYNPEVTNYTKAVTIKFDGRNEYKICSYRAEKIKEQNFKRRIIIEKLK